MPWFSFKKGDSVNTSSKSEQVSPVEPVLKVRKGFCIPRSPLTSSPREKKCCKPPVSVKAEQPAPLRCSNCRREIVIERVSELDAAQNELPGLVSANEAASEESLKIQSL